MSNMIEGMKKYFNSFCNIMEHNTNSVKIGCYTVALVGFTIATRRVRPFSRFKRPSDIPNHFIRERRELLGTVKRIEPNGGLLMILHTPLIKIPGTKSGHLPVKIAGIKVAGNGVSWLQSIVAGNEVKFIPILKNKNYIQCEVLLSQLTPNKKIQVVNVGESLAGIGFGTVEEIEKQLVKNKEYIMYYNKLKASETNALKKKMGVKYYIKPTKLAFQAFSQKIKKLITKAKPSKIVPKLALT